MTTFIESPRFPDLIAAGTRGGPRYKNSQVGVVSGKVYRNLLWSYPRHEYDAACGVNTAALLEQLLYFYHVVGGPNIGFRMKDWADYKSCIRSATPAATDCEIGTGDGATAAFQTYKKYVQGSYSRLRKILKIVSGTLLVAVAGSAQTEGTHFNANYNTGVITFTAGNIPASEAAVTAGFEFDVPVFFAQDIHNYTWADFDSGSAQVPLIEDKYGD